MTMKPCLSCGEPIDDGRCTDCRPTDTDMTTERGYDHRCRVLSERARKLQPFCTTCGTTADLTTDHSPEACLRKAAGKPMRLSDVHGALPGVLQLPQGARTAH